MYKPFKFKRLLIIVSVFLLAGCQPSHLQTAMGLNFMQQAKIQKTLLKNHVSYDTIAKVELANLGYRFEAYEISGGEPYEKNIVILDKNSKEFQALLDCDLKLKFGMLDSSVFSDLTEDE